MAKKVEAPRRGRPPGSKNSTKNSTSTKKAGKRGRPAGSKNGTKKSKQSSSKSESPAYSIVRHGTSNRYSFIDESVGLGKRMLQIQFNPGDVLINGVECDAREVMMSLRRLSKKNEE
jgi:hypothetical protein